MKKRIHTFDEWDVGLPEPPLPFGMLYARRHIGDRRAVCRILEHYGSAPWSEQILSTPPTREEATNKLINLVLKKPRQIQADEIKKHYWLMPPEKLAELVAEVGPLFDVCPYPRPVGFNGLTMEWSDDLMNYVNPIFEKTDGEGISDWVKKMIVEQAKGRDSTLTFPCYSWFHLLLNAGAEMKSMGPIHWLATEDGTPQKASLPIVRFTLWGKKK